MFVERITYIAGRFPFSQTSDEFSSPREAASVAYDERPEFAKDRLRLVQLGPECWAVVAPASPGGQTVVEVFRPGANLEAFWLSDVAPHLDLRPNDCALCLRDGEPLTGWHCPTCGAVGA
jgi:hypothetical protein